MDENRAEFIASVAAMRMLLGHLYTTVYVIAGLSPDDVHTNHEALLKKLSSIPLGRSKDAAISDLLSDVTFQNIEAFLRGVEASHEATWKRQSEDSA
jgi:hypothetical protein